VHKLRNVERKAPKHALAEIRDDFHRIVYAANADAARRAYTAFERTWAKCCAEWGRSRWRSANTRRRQALGSGD
jgi:transposase-like protein